MPYQVLGFHLAYSKSGIQTIKNHYNIFDQLIPTWIEVKEDGDIEVKKSNPAIHFCMEKEQIIPMVQNYNMKSIISNKLIADKKAINNFIEQSISYLDKEDYQELCIDIEGVKYGNKKIYTDFIAKVAEDLHEKGYCLSVAIPAKSENNQDSTWSGAYDYSLLGQIVDRVLIMAYDFHWPGGPPGPISPLSWFQDVIDYAIIEIPLEKLFFGIGLYGYDWTIDNQSKARGLIFQQIMDIAEQYSVKIEWDQESQSPYIRYNDNGVDHEIWFENKESISKKLKLIEEFQLKGIAFWRLGQEDPAIWELFGQK